MNSKFMNIALNEAKKAYNINETPIGAVIVKNDIIIARAYNKRETSNLATSHAEVLAINKACKKLKSWRLDDCEMYITLEPCMMCLGAIIQSRIKKIYIDAKEPKNGCICSVMDIKNINTTHKIQYEFIENDNKSEKLLKMFFKELRVNKKIEKNIKNKK